MSFVTLEEAQARLGDLIRGLVPGEELFITEDDRIVARLIASPRPGPRKSGTLKGTVLYMAPDFDAPLEGFEDDAE